MRDTAEARELVCVWGKRFGGKANPRYSKPYPKSTAFFGTNPQERSELEDMKDGLLRPVAGDYAWRSFRVFSKESPASKSSKCDRESDNGPLRRRGPIGSRRSL